LGREGSWKGKSSPRKAKMRTPKGGREVIGLSRLARDGNRKG